MTREEAKEWTQNEMRHGSPTRYWIRGEWVETFLIDQIFDQHEAELKQAKDALQSARGADQTFKYANRLVKARSEMERLLKALDKEVAEVDELEHECYDKDQEIERLKADKSYPDDCKYNRFGSDSLGYATDCTLIKPCKRIIRDYYTPKD